MDRRYSKEYVLDTLNELFEELHEVVLVDLESSDPFFYKRKDAYEKIQFIGNLHKLRDIIEDYVPLIFINYVGDIPLKDIMRGHLDVLNEYQGIEIAYNLGNEMKYASEPKLGAKKGKAENIKSFQKKIKDILSLMGVGTYPLSSESQNLVEELTKAFNKPTDYLSPNRIGATINNPKNKDVLTRFFNDLPMVKDDNYKKLLEEYLYNIT